ncbi:translation initiation factor IF-2 [Porticoccus sp. Uisw_050_02]|jgi:translation initiation factor IF-2|uniref:translation initiation factor IF-2 n=1 Tax=Porticoccus sp. Uisw_050_02 TaxID=3230978 RepID=UPI0039ECFADB|tara:strand:- start:14325 stop:16862 length:2538 start_codon:yes stop_codon:yes gene_type:complete
MAEVTVSELAKLVGTSVERLLSQMQEAGLSQDKPDAVVDDQEKQILLAHLKSLHGGTSGDPKKVTLKRKTLSTLKTSAGRKTVNVEIRKKRTYVKRDDEGIEVNPDENKNLEITTIDAEDQRQAAIISRRVSEAQSQEIIQDSGSNNEEKKNQSVENNVAPTVSNPVSGDINEIPVEPTKTIKKHAKVYDIAPVNDEKEEIAKKPKKRAAVKEPKRKIVDLLKAAEEESEEENKPRLRTGVKIAKVKNVHTFKKPTDKIFCNVEIPEEILVSDLAKKMSVKATVVIKALMKLGTVVSINEPIDQDTAILVAEELGHTTSSIAGSKEEEAMIEALQTPVEEFLVTRAPVVTVMGHVDHGKTSLLDYIRKSRVASAEAGGITQHIGAYHVDTPKGMITFLDTPGHAAFTAMRARGAQSTDVIILVVAADDGVMPQTEEAIQHARAAGVPLIIAINKIDKESADSEKVTNELSAAGVIPESWGGDTQFIEVSAQTGVGIDDLLEAVLLQAELLELKASSSIPAKGVIIESRLEKGRGAVATVLVQAGKLKKGDLVLAGESLGRIRAMSDQAGKTVTDAGPSIPVEILGLDAPPAAGDEFLVVSDERKAKQLAEFRQNRVRDEAAALKKSAKLENMFATFEGGEEKSRLPIVVKADVRGSLEAILAALHEMGNEEVEIEVICSGVGGISESDINLAVSSRAAVIGFNVRADNTARRLSEEEGLDLRYYSVIYNVLDDVRQALSGLLSPERREEILGIAEVRDVFGSPKFGAIAGCMVIEGVVFRHKPIRVLRDSVVIYQGELESLRRFKDEASEVRNGVECGIGVKDYNDIKSGDQIEVYEITEIARKL